MSVGNNNTNDFRGQVKIADVKAKFTSLVEDINEAIDAYNANITSSGSIDFNNGAATLAPKGYSLSVGGLKLIMKAYSGLTIGCDVYKISDTELLVTNGLYFEPSSEEDGIPTVVQLPYKIIDNVALASEQSLFYCIETSTYKVVSGKRDVTSFTDDDNNVFLNITPLNLNRGTKYVCTRDFENEDLDNYHCYTANNSMGDARYTDQSTSTKTGSKFIGACSRAGGKSTKGILKAWGTEIMKVVREHNRSAHLHSVISFLWLPKNISSPFAREPNNSESTPRWRVSKANFEWDED